MAPSEADKAALYQDLLSIYARAGAEVTYETDRGEIKPYWAKRFLQAVKRANKNDELFEFVERLVGAEEVSRGFLILKKAGRLDLTVEALVCDESKSYHHCFSRELVATARARLVDHGYEQAAHGQTGAGEAKAAAAVATPATLSPGATFDVRVTVGNDGALSLSLI